MRKTGEYLLAIYEKYPIHELIIHPRIQTDMYRGVPRLGAYEKAVNRLQKKMPLCYNGNLFSAADYKRITGVSRHLLLHVWKRADHESGAGN